MLLTKGDFVEIHMPHKKEIGVIKKVSDTHAWVCTGLGSTAARVEIKYVVKSDPEFADRNIHTNAAYVDSLGTRAQMYKDGLEPDLIDVDQHGSVVGIYSMEGSLLWRI